MGGEGAVGPASSCAEVPVVPPADVEEPLVAAVEPERRIHCRERVRGQGGGVRKPVAADGRTPRAANRKSKSTAEERANTTC